MNILSCTVTSPICQTVLKSNKNKKTGACEIKHGGLSVKKLFGNI